MAYRHRSRGARIGSVLEAIPIYTIQKVCCRKDLGFRRIASGKRGDEGETIIGAEGLLAERAEYQVKRKLCEAALGLGPQDCVTLSGC